MLLEDVPAVSCVGIELTSQAWRGTVADLCCSWRQVSQCIEGYCVVSGAGDISVERIKVYQDS